VQYEYCIYNPQVQRYKRTTHDDAKLGLLTLRKERTVVTTTIDYMMSRVNERKLYTDIYNEANKTMQQRRTIQRQRAHTSNWIQIYALNCTMALGWVAIGCIDRHWLWLQCWMASSCKLRPDGSLQLRVPVVLI